MSIDRPYCLNRLLSLSVFWKQMFAAFGIPYLNPKWAISHEQAMANSGKEIFSNFRNPDISDLFWKDLKAT